MVGPAGFEPTTFTRNSASLLLRVSSRSRSSSFPPRVSKPVSSILEPVVITLSSGSSLDLPWLDYGPYKGRFYRIRIYRFLALGFRVSSYRSRSLIRTRQGLDMLSVELSENLMNGASADYCGCRPKGAGPTRTHSELGS